MTTHTEETKEKMRKAWTPQRRYDLAQRNKRFKNRVVSEETRKKISIATSGKNNPMYGTDRSGERNPMYGKHLSEESKKKMSESKKGTIVSEKTREILSINNSGSGNPMYGRNHTEEAKKKISDANKGRLIGELNPFFGKHHTEETKSIISAAHWIDGRSYEPYCPKWTPELRERIRAFFGYECILCGKSENKNNRKLDCHHVEYDKQACCDGKEVHFAALCRSCHTKTNFDRERWENIIHRIIIEIYSDRSYFTKEEYLNRCNK